MGGWKLEVMKMGVYLAFPVALFYYFNQPEFFEKWVTNVRRELYPPEKRSQREEIEKVISIMQERHEIQMLNALKEKEERKTNHL